MTFTREQFAKEGDEAGVFISGLGSALVTWVAMLDHHPTVREAAVIFNTTDAVIREAVEDAMWAYLEGPDDDPLKQKIELDGAVVDYISRYGGRCRDCADEDGVCPHSGLPCGNAEKAIRHVIKAYNYGISNGFLKA